MRLYKKDWNIIYLLISFIEEASYTEATYTKKINKREIIKTLPVASWVDLDRQEPKRKPWWLFKFFSLL